MAVTAASDFKIYNEEFYGGMVETITQFLRAFGPASRGAITIIPRSIKGDYVKESFLKQVATLVSRRDTTSTSAATSLKQTMGEIVEVKVNRKVGPVTSNIDAWRKVGIIGNERAQRAMSVALGRQSAARQLQDYLNTGLLACGTALEGQANLSYDGSAAQLSHAALVNGLRLFGDAGNDVVLWAMHSSPWYDLIAGSLSSTNMIANVGGMVVNEGTVGTLGRPALLTDSSSLTDGSGSAQTFDILGLTVGALIITEAEPMEVYAEIVGGYENLQVRIQGEYAFNIRVKGFAWDVANGGANPSDATLGTTTNWDKAVTDDKSCAGVRIKAKT